MRKKLPIGIQNFREIREEGYYYVDKTDFALQLVEQGKYYFLSRPRRFGKSLFLDTLKELFEGNESLFRGLYAHDKWDWTVSYPVIRISFGGGVIRNRIELEDRLSSHLARMEKACGLATCTESIPERFRSLIIKLHQQTGQRVVVLIDEYDKPILDQIEKIEMALENRECLKDLYSIIKDSDEYIRFAFLTGVSKFSKVSLFSGLNNLRDITLDKRYSAICGYTHMDVDTVFAPELEGLDREDIKRWYNGYNWLGDHVYNPFDLLLLFDRREFGAYWFETGTPTFLVKLLAQKQFFTPDLASLKSSHTLLSTFDVDQIAPEALLFQTGYLTIRDFNEPMTGHWVYTLGYPNIEVETSLNSALLGSYGVDERTSFETRLSLLDILKANNLSAMKDLFHTFFASIPHDWYRKNHLANFEGYYASIFYSYFAAMGLDIRVEDCTNKGRIDMAVCFQGRVYLFEFKVVELVPEGKAIEQLKTKRYAEKYLGSNKSVYLIGIEFSRKDRNIVGFDVETLAAGAH